MPKFRDWLVANCDAEAELAAIEAETDRDIDEAVEFMRASPYPEVSELRLDVYAEEIQP